MRSVYDALPFIKVRLGWCRLRLEGRRAAAEGRQAGRHMQAAASQRVEAGAGSRGSGPRVPAHLLDARPCPPACRSLHLRPPPLPQARGLRSVELPNPLNLGFDYHAFLVVSRGCWSLRCRRCHSWRRWRDDAGAVAAQGAPGCAPAGARGHHRLMPALPCAPSASPPRHRQVLLALYPFLWFRLYAFLFSQRRRKLAPAPAAAAGKKRA